jgi:GPH family glycoside/pentoside/hexuronide:cation symporter
MAPRRSNPAAATQAGWQQALYGFFALPLAFAALPLYVQWPAHAAGTWGLPLATLGALLLSVRVADAVIDPWIGARIDALFAQSWRRGWAAAGLAGVLIACGMAALMFAPAAVTGRPTALLAWSAAALLTTSMGYSIAMVTHQAWAVRLGDGAVAQARWVGTREALALVGVIIASVLPSLGGWALTVATLAVLLLLAWWALARVPPPTRDGAGRGEATPRTRAAQVAEAPRGEQGAPGAPAARVAPTVKTAAVQRSPWRDRGFRRLLAVTMVSGLASAVPASLVVLYVRDLLQTPGAAEGWLLGLYFAAAALGMPLWVRAVRRFGLVRCWLAGMALSITAFAGAGTLGPGDLPAFAVICVAAGLALGADLVVPPSLLAGLIQKHGQGDDEPVRAADRGPDHLHAPHEARGVEGLWFGWWNFASKLTLALAAGLALPLLQWLGYRPGARDDASLSALAFSYAFLPCAIKAAAALLLWMQRDAWPSAAIGVHEALREPT